MDFSFKLEKKDKKVNARAGIIKTPHGQIQTPCFSPVATRASVKTLSPDDIKMTNSQVVLSNTYHLYLRPGLKILKSTNGFANFMGWEGPTITDSGGYQVSFLWEKGKDESMGKITKIDDSGAIFSSYIDGKKTLLTPEISMDIQKVLAADIIMAFDQPLGQSNKHSSQKESFERTLDWEERSLIAWQKNKCKSIQNKYQALYGIVQGEEKRQLRKKSLDFVLSMGFPGIALGGQSIGADPMVTASAMNTIVDLLPDNRPLHALGLGGGPHGIFEAVERGIDTFDNTGITRMARCGLLYIYPEDGGNIKNKFRIDINKSLYKESKKPISKVCNCYTCRNFTLSYLHHLQVSGEILGLRLSTIHNITYINNLMSEIRKNILNNDFSDYKKHWLKLKS